MKLVHLKTPNGYVCVNPERVTCVEPASREGCANVHFEGEFVTVLGTVAEVADRIETRSEMS